VAVTHGFISKDTVPDIPYIRLPKNQKHRRDDLTAKEWEELERVARLYYIKGKTRILDEKYTIKKNSQGKYETISNIAFKGPRDL
jgi:hypothetical protein|tara:strand:- start:148 stop:402 length:255 start_codon:yes stop_codon:yes gene_type:complete